MSDDIRTTKILCHSEGGPFANYCPNPKETGYVYAVYMTEEAVGPDPATLGIVVKPGTFVDLTTLVWRHLEAYTSPIPERDQVAGTFNFTKGEFQK